MCVTSGDETERAMAWAGASVILSWHAVASRYTNAGRRFIARPVGLTQSKSGGVLGTGAVLSTGNANERLQHRIDGLDLI